MKAFAGSLLMLLMLSLAADKLSSQAVAPAPGHAVSPAEYERWKKELSNWGRWGKDDQIGTLNLITPAKRKEAAGLVKEGVSVSLARTTEMSKAVDNQNPFGLEMNWTGASSPGQFALDTYHVLYHGF